MMPFFLGIDVGTSSLKTGLWRSDGHLAARASRSYPTHRPSAVRAEQNPLDWWQALCETVRQVLAEGGARADEIAGIGIDSTGWTFVPVDKAGQPLYPAMLWQDRRAVKEAAWLRALPKAEQLVHLSANRLDEGYATPKVLWLRAHHPELYTQIDQILFSSGYLVRKLTSVSICDYSQANGLHCFDMHHLRWDEQACEWLGVERDKLPPVVDSCRVIGEVTREAAGQIGLKPGTPVIAGGLDAAVAALGNGVARAGMTADQGGTAFGMSVAVDRVVIEPRLIFSAHVVPGLYLLQGGTVGGGSLDWLRRQLQPNGQVADASDLDRDFSKLTAEAAQSAAGAGGVLFLPYMSGERSPLWDSEARGVFLGMSYETTRGDLIRALMEGCVFAVRHNMQIAEEAGAPIVECYGSGGTARSADWCQLKADVTGRPLTICAGENGEPGDNTLGLAVMVGVATGHYRDLADTMAQFLPRRRTLEPNPHHQSVYDALYPIFRRAYEDLRPAFAALSSVRRGQQE
jgi:xylulokinase